MAAATTQMTFDPARLAAWSIILAVSLSFLVLGKSFLIPLAIATLLWILLDAIRELLIQRTPLGKNLPGWSVTLLAITVVIVANYLVISVITSQSDEFQAAIPVYQTNFASLADGLASSLSVDELPTTQSLLDRLDFAALFSWLGDSVTALMSDIVLIAIYVGFLLAEERILPEKIARLQKDSDAAGQIQQLASNIAMSVQRYIGMKTLVSAVTGLVSYLVLILVGVDFAAIWALLIFFLNFIPNIGSVLGVAFPALLTLVQFDSLTPFVIVVVGLGGAQFLIGNVLEPAFMGKSLNMSSFMMILALSFWGMIWGLAGMFLAVPLMVVTGIVCSHFSGLRWISVMLSADGRLIQDKK